MRVCSCAVAMRSAVDSSGGCVYAKGAGLVLSMRVMSVCVHHAVPVSSGLAGRALVAVGEADPCLAA